MNAISRQVVYRCICSIDLNNKITNCDFCVPKKYCEPTNINCEFNWNGHCISEKAKLEANMEVIRNS